MAAPTQPGIDAQPDRVISSHVPDEESPLIPSGALDAKPAQTTHLTGVWTIIAVLLLGK